MWNSQSGTCDIAGKKVPIGWFLSVFLHGAIIVFALSLKYQQSTELAVPILVAELVQLPSVSGEASGGMSLGTRGDRIPAVRFPGRKSLPQKENELLRYTEVLRAKVNSKLKNSYATVSSGNSTSRVPAAFVSGQYKAEMGRRLGSFNLPPGQGQGKPGIGKGYGAGGAPSGSGTGSGGMFSASGYKAALESKLLAPVSRSPKVENVKTVRSEVPKIESERIPLPVLLSVGVPGTKVPAWYLQKIRDKIDANWNLRKKFALSGEKVLISFCIQQNGVISKLSLDRQAKSSTFNDSAMEAVQKSIPFPPLPQEINVSSLDITIAFSAKGIQ